MLGIPGEEHLITNEEFLTLNALLERIVMVGGGYIAAEFSHIAARAGARVTVLQRGERMLTHFEPELVGWLMEKFQAVGIDVRTGTAPCSPAAHSTGFPAMSHQRSFLTLKHCQSVVSARVHDGTDSA
jgi:glutathione reductase (NADPH)